MAEQIHQVWKKQLLFGSVLFPCPVLISLLLFSLVSSLFSRSLFCSNANAYFTFCQGARKDMHFCGTSRRAIDLQACVATKLSLPPSLPYTQTRIHTVSISLSLSLSLSVSLLLSPSHTSTLSVQLFIHTSILINVHFNSQLCISHGCITSALEIPSMLYIWSFQGPWMLMA